MSIGLIVGSGMDSLAEAVEWAEIPTPYGPAFLGKGVIGDITVTLVRRHGPLLNVPPHMINYHANIYALSEAGVSRIIATAAVGSLRKELRPGTLAVVNDFIDFTRHRATTVFDKVGDSVMHVDFSRPYCPRISDAIRVAASDLGIDLGEDVTYICVDGPRYETPAEVRMFAQWGADVVGMTGVPEVTLSREMGLCYGALAVVTNYAAGVTPGTLSHMDVLASVAQRKEQIRAVLERALWLIPEACTC